VTANVGVMLLPFSVSRVMRSHVVGAVGLAVAAAGAVHSGTVPSAAPAVQTPAVHAPAVARSSTAAEPASPKLTKGVATTLPSSSAAASVVSVGTASAAANYAAQIVTLVNAQRASHGLKALAPSACLTGFATPWAKHLASIKALAHQSLGPFLSDCHATSAAENVGMGNVTAASMMAAFMASPDHKANILATSSNHLAVAAYESAGVWYVVQDFYGN
jgi:uncharacterized protein YkwD